MVTTFGTVACCWNAVFCWQLPDKSISSLVKYYYSWKKTRSRTSLIDRHAHKVSASRNVRWAVGRVSCENFNIRNVIGLWHDDTGVSRIYKCLWSIWFASFYQKIIHLQLSYSVLPTTRYVHALSMLWSFCPFYRLSVTLLYKFRNCFHCLVALSF